MQLGFPFQEFLPEVRVYYYFQIGMYLSLLYSISSDTKRKDYAEARSANFCMQIQLAADGHPSRGDDSADEFLVVVRCLHGDADDVLSHCSQGYWRIGTLVLIIHDVSDIFLEAAKSMKYLRVCPHTDIHPFPYLLSRSIRICVTRCLWSLQWCLA